MSNLNLKNSFDCINFLEEHWGYSVELINTDKIEVLNAEGEVAFEISFTNEEEQYKELYTLCVELWDSLVQNGLSEDIVAEVMSDCYV